jgi:p-hydroxybenzoate 3-monooxygenase
MNLKTRVGIIGAGPAGLTLGLLLRQAGIDCVILETRSRDYIESRVRAGLLEQNTVELFDRLGISGRLHLEGQKHHGVNLSFEAERIRIPFDELTGGRCITIYGQQEVIKDLLKANLEQMVPVHFDCTAARITDMDCDSPRVAYIHEGEEHILACDFVAGCDGYHGVSRKSMPEDTYREFSKEYPFSWLGILARASPATEELIYSYHERGFALHSLRSARISRLYFQVDNGEKLDHWTDEQIWDELQLRLGDNKGFTLNRGEIYEKAITPVRGYLVDNMQYGRLFLAGDAAHIVPPTGGKGLNLAVADIRHLAEALECWYRDGNSDQLKAYSSNCLRRVWRAQEFSNYMTSLFHKQAPAGSFEYYLQKARFKYISRSRAQATTIAENYVGLKEI